MDTLDPIEIRKSVMYDACTGRFYLVGGKLHKQAGHVGKDGYRTIVLHGKSLAAHRLAWAYIYNVWPTHFIDHINRSRDDNRIVNLRDVTREVNNQNTVRSNHRIGVSGFRGATRILLKSGEARYVSTVVRGRRRKYLGTFKTAEAAHRAYMDTLEEWGYA